jgi:hypothetical protein
MVLSDLLNDILGRVEESTPTDPSPGPIFWNLTGEVYPAMVQAMFEAALITGVVQVNSLAVTLAANQTYFDIQGAASVVPKGMLAPLRLKAPYPIRKTTLNGLDLMKPSWQQAAPTDQMIAWFPLGVSKFGIYPQLNAEATVVMDFISSPVNHSTPYTGTETLPFQVEFNDLLSQYGAAFLRSKEGGAEAEEGAVVYEDYLGRIKALSAFQGRLDNLVFTGAVGGRTQVNPRTVV